MKKGVVSILSTMFGTVIGAGTVGRIAGTVRKTFSIIPHDG